MSKAPNSQIYLISPQQFVLDDFKDLLKQAFDGGAIGAFQLRMKDVAEADILKAAEALLPICHDYGTQFIMNDSAGLALKVGADGLHIGEEFEEYDNARKLLGKNKVIGVSCYGSKDRAIKAGEKGADYVSFGQFYETKTKPPKGRPGPEILEWWTTYTVLPCVAIGGVKPENCRPLVQAGADFVAVVSYVWEHPESPKVAVRQLNEAII